MRGFVDDDHLFVINANWEADSGRKRSRISQDDQSLDIIDPAIERGDIVARFDRNTARQQSVRLVNRAVCRQWLQYSNWRLRRSD